MSKVDTVFGSIASPLVNEWGVAGEFVRKGVGVYNPTTGVVTATPVRIPMKIVLLKANPREYGGLHQIGDIKAVLDPVPIGRDGVSVGDWIEYPGRLGPRKAVIVDVTEYQGDSPVYFAVLARPQ